MVYNTVNISYTSAEPYAEVEGTVWVGETLYFSFSSDVEFSLENKYNLLVYLGEEDFIVSFFPLDQSTTWEIVDGKLVGLVTLNTKQLVDYYNDGIFIDNIKFALYNNNEEPIRLCYGDIYCNGIQNTIKEPIDIEFLIKSYSNHRHTGLDGSKKISHFDLLDAGTKSHSELETDISNINSDILFVKKDIEDTNSTVEALSATVGNSTFLFLKNNNEHKDFETRMDNTDSVIKTLENRIIGNESTFQSKLDQNSQEVENVKNKNYLQKTIADGLYLTIVEYNKKVHCNILAPVKTINDLPSITDSEIGDIRLVLDDNMAYVRYYDDDGSGVNGWASLGISMEELRKIENKLTIAIENTKTLVNNHINNTNNPHQITPEQIKALPTVDGVAENLKKKTTTDTKTVSFSWGTGSYGTIKAVFDEYGYFNDGYVDIGGNWVRNPQENLFMYYYGSVSGLREDLIWYNVSCSDYVYPDENASDDNYDYAYNFYLGYDESNGIFVEVAFEMYVYNEETGESGYEYIENSCAATPWEDVIIDSPVLSEYDLLDDEGIIKSEKIPPISESDPKFNSWKSGTSIAAGNRASASGSYGIAIGRVAKAEKTNGIAIGKEAYALAENSIQIGNGQNATANSVKFLNYRLIEGGRIYEERLPYGKRNTNLTSDFYNFPPNLIITYPTMYNADMLAPKIDLENNIGAIIIGSGARVTNTMLVNIKQGGIVIGSAIKRNSSSPSSDGISSKSTEEEIAEVAPSTSSGVSIGASAQSSYGVSIGSFAKSYADGISIGVDANSTGSRRSSTAIAIGQLARISSSNGIAIGYRAGTDDGLTPSGGVAIGSLSNIKDSILCIAIGNKAKIALSTDTSDGVEIENAVQLGTGTNSKSNSLQFLDTTLFENGKLNLDTIVLNDSVANEDGTVNKYKLKVTNGVLGVELITEEATA